MFGVDGGDVDEAQCRVDVKSRMVGLDDMRKCANYSSAPRPIKT